MKELGILTFYIPREIMHRIVRPTVERVPEPRVCEHNVGAIRVSYSVEKTSPHCLPELSRQRSRTLSLFSPEPSLDPSLVPALI